MQKLERVVDQLCHAVPGFGRPLTAFAPETVPRSMPSLGPGDHPFAYTTAAPPMIPAIYQAISADLRGGRVGAGRGYSSSGHSVDTDAHSHTSFGEGQTYIGSLHPPSSSATQTRSIAAPLPANRPTSTSTVRGATSRPALGARAPDVSDLAAQLDAERAARQALEVQVRRLSERLNGLSSTMFAMVRDPARSQSQERLVLGTSSSSATTPTAPPPPR